MRRWFFVLVVVLSMTGLTAFSIPLCEYRSPVTDLADLGIGFSYQYHNDPFGQSDSDINEGDFTVEYVRLFDRPEFGFDVNVRNDMRISVLDVSTYTTLADGSYKRYFSSEGDAFAFAGASVRSSSWFESLGLSVNLGVGVGRFVDVTPLARATRIEEYLVDRGSLTDHLHPVDLQILADEIGSLAKYESLAALLAAAQDVIEGSSNIKIGGLDALDLSEITRLIQAEGFSRYCGWDLRLGLGYELLDPSGGENDLLVTGSFNYAFTTTPSEQFLVQGSFSGPPELMDTNRIDVTVAYDCLVSDFLSLTATYDFSRETWASEATDIHRLAFDMTLEPLDTAQVTLGVVFEHRPYFVEWKIDLKLTIGIDIL
ncbi:MAG: hypothetical protein WBC63_02605 [Candidatus Bipolaricaulia bacterium]